MNILDPLVVTRLIIILGIINVTAGLLIFFSCRCLPGAKIGTWLMKHQSYQRYYKYHCYIWRVFWTSVISHALLTIIFLGWPA